MKLGPYARIPYSMLPVIDRMLRRGDLAPAAFHFRVYGYPNTADSLLFAQNNINSAIECLNTTMYLASISGTTSSYMWLGKDADNA